MQILQFTNLLKSNFSHTGDYPIYYSLKIIRSFVNLTCVISLNFPYFYVISRYFPELLPVSGKKKIVVLFCKFSFILCRLNFLISTSFC